MQTCVRQREKPTSPEAPTRVFADKNGLILLLRVFALLQQLFCQQEASCCNLRQTGKAVKLSLCPFFCLLKYLQRHEGKLNSDIYSEGVIEAAVVHPDL